MATSETCQLPARTSGSAVRRSLDVRGAAETKERRFVEEEDGEALFWRTGKEV